MEEAEKTPTRELGAGIHPGIHEDLYRNFNAVSYSDLKDWIKPFKGSTDRMRIGKALHSLILEPEQAKSLYWTAPKDLDRRTTVGKDTYARWVKENPHKTVLLPREREELRQLLLSVRSDDDAMRIIKAPGNNEVSVVTKLPGHKILSKCRIDMMRRGCLVDLKTTGTASKEEFENSIIDFKYNAQSAYYQDQVCSITNEFLPWIWICVSTRNFKCWVSKSEPYHYASGAQWYNDLLTLKERFDG